MQTPQAHPRLLPLLVAMTCTAFAGVVPDSVKVEYDDKKPLADVSFRLDANEAIMNAQIFGYDDAGAGSSVGEAPFTPFTSLPDHSIACAYVIDFPAEKRSKMTQNKNFSKTTVHDFAKSDAVTQTGIFGLGRDLVQISLFGDQSTLVALDRMDRYNMQGDVAKSSFIVQNLSEVLNKHLLPVQAKRKVIVLFTDGGDDNRTDATWTTRLEGLITQCKEKDVAVYVVAFAQEKSAWDKNYPWLKDLTSRTGGLMVAATVNEERLLPAEQARIVPSFTSGGKVTVDLAKLAGKKQWQVRLVTPTNAPFFVPAAKQAVPAVKVPDPNKPDVIKPDPNKQDITKIDQIKVTPWYLNPWIWAAVAVPCFLLLILVALLIFRKKPEPVSPLVMTPDEPTHIIAPQFAAPAVGGARKPLAWLEMMDAEGSREAISTTNLRIGRGKDNDLVLSNKSVSSHHCVIQQARDGTWSINDLKSGNGVYVNDRRVEHNKILDGDVVELGEVKMRFRTAN